MGAALGVTRTDHTAWDLRYHAGKSVDGAQVRRLLALASVLEGRSRGEAAAQSGMDRQTLRDWVHRYNAAGIDGLKSRTSPGRAPALSAAQMAELRALVVAGPDPAEHQVVRWRCVDVQVEVVRKVGPFYYVTPKAKVPFNPGSIIQDDFGLSSLLLGFL